MGGPLANGRDLGLAMWQVGTQKRGNMVKSSKKSSTFLLYNLPTICNEHFWQIFANSKNTGCERKVDGRPQL